jgi:hypothetical protein
MIKKDPTEIIIANPEFKQNLLNTISRVKTGKVTWHKYNLDKMAGFFKADKDLSKNHDSYLY